VQINLDKNVFDHRGRPIKMSDEGAPARLSDLLEMALINLPPEDAKTPAEKMAAFDLLKRITRGGRQQLAVEEIAKLKRAVSAVNASVVVHGAVITALENDDVPMAITKEA
jgi:hypothetical protein